jgi:hypothetical protein
MANVGIAVVAIAAITIVSAGQILAASSAGPSQFSLGRDRMLAGSWCRQRARCRGERAH